MYMIILNRIINDIRNVVKLSKLPLIFFKTISLTNDKKDDNSDAKGATNLLPNDKEISSLIAPYTKDDFSPELLSTPNISKVNNIKVENNSRGGSHIYERMLGMSVPNK